MSNLSSIKNCNSTNVKVLEQFILHSDEDVIKEVFGCSSAQLDTAAIFDSDVIDISRSKNHSGNSEAIVESLIHSEPLRNNRSGKNMSAMKKLCTESNMTVCCEDDKSYEDDAVELLNAFKKRGEKLLRRIYLELEIIKQKKDELAVREQQLLQEQYPQFTSTYAIKGASFPRRGSARRRGSASFNKYHFSQGAMTYNSAPKISHRIPSLPVRPVSSTTRGSSSSLKYIFSNLPWLKKILTNGVLSLSKGNYKLGLNETITDKVLCTNAPQNSAGHCALIHSCEKVHSLLISKDVYEQYFCVLKTEYAGVCCPIVN